MCHNPFTAYNDYAAFVFDDDFLSSALDVMLVVLRFSNCGLWLEFLFAPHNVTGIMLDGFPIIVMITSSFPQIILIYKVRYSFSALLPLLSFLITTHEPLLLLTSHLYNKLPA